jgi:hypothetical protein
MALCALTPPRAPAQVPILTEDTIDLLPNDSLVRFRGMVSASWHVIGRLAGLHRRHAATHSPTGTPAAGGPLPAAP